MKLFAVIAVVLWLPPSVAGQNLCCSWNFRDCGGDAWCNHLDFNCDRCGGHWVATGGQCAARWESCTGEAEQQGNCCPGLWCHHTNAHWRSCVPAPEDFVGNPTTPLTQAPVVESTPAPVGSTFAPVSPTLAPVEPTMTPFMQTDYPITFHPVTFAPIDPTTAPAMPTDSPITLHPVTSAPIDSTMAPVMQTDSPITFQPVSSAPVDPTIAPATPTDSPVTLHPVTSAPIDPTMTPVVQTDFPVTLRPVTSSPVAFTLAPVVQTDTPVSVAPVTIAPVESTLSPVLASGAPVTSHPITISPVSTFACEIDTNVLKFAIIAEEDATLNPGWFNENKGILVGGDLTDGNNNWSVIGGESFVGGDMIGSNWNWNGGIKLGSEGYSMSEFVDFEHLKFLAAHAEAVIENEYKVVVVDHGGTFSMTDLFPDSEVYNNGLLFAIFNTEEDVVLNAGSDGKDIGFSTLAPFSKLTADTSTVLGFLIGREVIDNSGGNHGKNYDGDTSCGISAPPPPSIAPTPAPTLPPTAPTTPQPTTAPITPFPTPAPVTRAPAMPTTYPDGPYITVFNASESIVLPDPEKPMEVARTMCPHEDSGLLDWDSPSTWSGTVPTGGSVTLPDNQRVIVRASINVVFGVVTIPASSELIFDESSAGITFDAVGFDVQGQLTIGSETCRHETPVTITLHGERPDNVVTNIPDPTFKGISVTGEINVHGRRFYRTWTRLALTAEVGDSVIMLQNEVNWMPGQEIVLVTTAMKDSREWHRNELALVQSVALNPVSGVGSAVVLSSPLIYQHVANTGYQGEVGLLTRMVKIQGDEDNSEPTDPDPLNCSLGRSAWGDKARPCPNTELTGFGGHIIVHSGGKGYVEGVELYRMGQTNVLGRYPMHFHLLGPDCSDCYFRDSSVHRSFYRCVSIHGTDATQISENVAYDVTGYCYYLEDGVEQENRIEFNLGAHIHALGDEPPWGPGQQISPVAQSDTLTLPADVTASAFYITNVKNYVIGNAASGGWAGFAFPNLPTPLGSHRYEKLRPSSVTGLTIDGNTAHSTAWWWYHAAAFYWGGSLYYSGDTLMYNPGRDQSNSRSTCVVNKCIQNNDCGSFCDTDEQAWLQVTNTKSFLAPGVGFGSWSGRLEVLGYECHDCGLSLESLSNGFWINNLLSVCRTQTPIVLPDDASATAMRADGFRWYDTNQEHIITGALFRNCGYRSEQYEEYDLSPTRGCGNENDMGCSSSSSVWSMLTHSDQFVPEMMQGTKDITFENCGRRFRQQDYRSNKPSSVSGREQNWYDMDGTVTGLGERSVVASGLADAGMWWEVDNEAIYDPQGPLWFFKLTSGPERGLGHFRMKWNPSLHDEVGSSQCGNGQDIPCLSLGEMKHVGDLFASQPGLPITANADIVGPVGGFGWNLELESGAPKSITFEQIEVDPSTPLLLSIAYPLGTSFTIVAHAAWCSDSDDYTCNEAFEPVDSILKVRSSLGNKYHVDSNGVLTLRIIQTPKTFVGNPDFFLPQWNDEGKWGNGYAIERFERDGVRLPKMAYGPYLSLNADCPSSDGISCSVTPATYAPNVCPAGYTQTGYDVCTSLNNPNVELKLWSDGSSNIP